METKQFRKQFINVTIGSLIGAAAVAVIAVLVGEFNDTLTKSLLTLSLVAIHSLASLTYVDNGEKYIPVKDLRLVNNVVFSLIVMSFITSIFGVWGLIADGVVAKLYGTYFVVLFASFHAAALAKLTSVDRTIDRIVYANYIFMAFVVLLLLPVIWWADTYADFLPDFYYRLLAANGIIDATLTILAIILHKVYLQKHPELSSSLYETRTGIDASGNPVQVRVENPKRKMHPLLLLLLIYLAGQILFSFVAFFL